MYNPDKWGYSQFEFYEVKPEIEEIGILHYMRFYTFHSRCGIEIEINYL